MKQFFLLLFYSIACLAPVEVANNSGQEICWVMGVVNESVSVMERNFASGKIKNFGSLQELWVLREPTGKIEIQKYNPSNNGTTKIYLLKDNEIKIENIKHIFD